MLNPKSVILAVAAPLIAAGSAWLCAAVAKYGVHLDPSGVNALAVAGATFVVGLALKLIHELERKNPKATPAVSALAQQIAENNQQTARLIDPGLQSPSAAPVSAPPPAAPPPAAA